MLLLLLLLLLSLLFAFPILKASCSRERKRLKPEAGEAVEGGGGGDIGGGRSSRQTIKHLEGENVVEFTW